MAPSRWPAGLCLPEAGATRFSSAPSPLAGDLERPNLRQAQRGELSASGMAITPGPLRG